MRARYAKIWLFAAVFFAASLCGLKDARAAFPLLTGSDMWNVTISGFTLGSGNIQFFDDVTLGKVVAGYIIIKAKPVKKNAPAQFDVGFFFLIGQWTIDASGTVTGFLSGGSAAVPLDISFTAKGTDFTSISMTGTSTNGPIHMKGIPVSKVFVPDLSGSWHATVVKDGTDFVELFDLTPSADICLDITGPGSCDLTLGAFNLYDMINAAGPGYVIIGNVLGSSGGQIGVVVEELSVNKDDGSVADSGPVRSVTGKLNAKKLPFSAGMSGADDNHSSVKMNMSE